MNSTEFKNKIITEINSTNITHNEILKQIKINLHFVSNPFLEITGNVEDDYDVKFYDGESLIHHTTLKNNMWTRLNRKYYTDWNVVVSNSSGDIIYESKLNLNNKRVYISFDSKSLGDTLAWIPYVEEFRKKHNCHLIVSTFLNHLFIDTYPNIEFVNPGTLVSNLYASYSVGWFYDENSNINYNTIPTNFRTQPLQKTITDILGLEFKEIKPNLKLNNTIPKHKKVGIAIHSTAQSKYWNNPTGWQEVVDYLKNIGYEVVLYSLEGDGYMGNFHPSGITQFSKGLDELIPDLQTCEFFIGISSGLSWLAWSVGLPVVLISGVTKEYTEHTLDTYRVINSSVCNGCFNSHRLDQSDWNWCPLQSSIDKKFECSKSITSSMVINKIQSLTGLF